MDQNADGHQRSRSSPEQDQDNPTKQPLLTIGYLKKNNLRYINAIVFFVDDRARPKLRAGAQDPSNNQSPYNLI